MVDIFTTKGKIMTKKELLDLTNAALVDKIEDYGIEDELAEIAKDASKPIKSEMVEVIFDYISKAKEKEVLVKDTVDEDGAAIQSVDMDKTTRYKFQKADLHRKECVVVIDNQNLSTKIPSRYVSWGNGYGIETDVVDFDNDNGAYIRRGALENLKGTVLNYTVQGKNKNIAGGSEDTLIVKSMPRYTIIPVEGLSEKEVSALRAEQRNKAAYQLNSI